MLLKSLPSVLPVLCVFCVTPTPLYFRQFFSPLESSSMDRMSRLNSRFRGPRISVLQCASGSSCRKRSFVHQELIFAGTIYTSKKIQQDQETETVLERTSARGHIFVLVVVE